MELNKAQTKKLEGLSKTSTKVRYLASLQMATGDIAKQLGIRYQHARNVLVTPVKKPAESF